MATKGKTLEKYLPVLRLSPLFRGLGDAEILSLCACLDLRLAAYGQGDVLWLAGDRVDRGGLVLSGAVRAEQVDFGGRRQIIAVHRPGGMFGDVLMSTPDARSPVDVVAAEDSRVLTVPFVRLMSGCERACPAHDRLRTNLIGEIGGKFWALNRRLLYLSRRGLRARVAAWLLEAGEEAGSDAVSAGCSREELADYLGVNRSALSRELRRMKDAGLIDYRRDVFRILDEEKLKREA